MAASVGWKSDQTCRQKRRWSLPAWYTLLANVQGLFKALEGAFPLLFLSLLEALGIPASSDGFALFQKGRSHGHLGRRGHGVAGRSPRLVERHRVSLGDGWFRLGLDWALDGGMRQLFEPVNDEEGIDGVVMDTRCNHSARRER